MDKVYYGVIDEMSRVLGGGGGMDLSSSSTSTSTSTSTSSSTTTTTTTTTTTGVIEYVDDHGDLAKVTYCLSSSGAGGTSSAHSSHSSHSSSHLSRGRNMMNYNTFKQGEHVAFHLGTDRRRKAALERAQAKDDKDKEKENRSNRSSSSSRSDSNPHSLTHTL